MNIIAQLFGIGAMVFLFSLYQRKNRKDLVLSKLCADLCWVVHYLCLGAYGGMIPNFVGMFRELVFVNRGSKKWANSILWPIFFILINFGLGITTFGTPINILPISASAFVTVSLWCKNPELTKIIFVPVNIAFLIYNFIVGSYIGVINESISLLSILIHYIRRITKWKTTR